MIKRLALHKYSALYIADAEVQEAAKCVLEKWDELAVRAEEWNIWADRKKAKAIKAAADVARSCMGCVLRS